MRRQRTETEAGRGSEETENGDRCRESERGRDRGLTRKQKRSEKGEEGNHEGLAQREEIEAKRMEEERAYIHRKKIQREQR